MENHVENAHCKIVRPRFPRICKACAVLIFVFFGSGGRIWSENSKTFPIRGQVLTPTREIVGSYLLPTLTDLGEGDRALAGAKIYLAFDREGKRPVQGYDTRSDENGLYEIQTSGIPATDRQDAMYYLIVENDGFERISQKTGVRFMGRYLQNSAVLKPVP